VIRGSERKRLDRQGGLISARGHEAQAVAQKEIPHVVRAMKLSDTELAGSLPTRQVLAFRAADHIGRFATQNEI